MWGRLDENQLKSSCSGSLYKPQGAVTSQTQNNVKVFSLFILQNFMLCYIFCPMSVGSTELYHQFKKKRFFRGWRRPHARPHPLKNPAAVNRAVRTGREGHFSSLTITCHMHFIKASLSAFKNRSCYVSFH